MGSKISKVETYLPERVLTNEHLAAEFGRWEPQKIEAKLGITERHISEKDETAGDMGFKAAERLFEYYDRNNIDMLILCTQSPDYFLPTTACVLQDRLDLRTDIGAYDFNLGCSGFIYGLAMAKGFINSNIAENVLLITSETYSKHIHPHDLANKTIFGDGAAATIIEKSLKDQIGQFILGTDGKGKNNLIVPNGGFRSAIDLNAEEKSSGSGDVYTDNNLFMNGPEIFNFTIDAVPIAIENCIARNNMKIEDVDYFIFHQANKYIIDFLRKMIKIPKEKFYSDMLNTGNTVSSTIPIGYKNAISSGTISEGSKVLLCGFGVGYSWGAVMVEV